MELAPGPPLSIIVRAEVGSRAPTNQKKRLVGYSPGTVTQPVYCFWRRKAVVQTSLGSLYEILMFGLEGEVTVFRPLAWDGGNCASLRGARTASVDKVRSCDNDGEAPLPLLVLNGDHMLSMVLDVPEELKGDED